MPRPSEAAENGGHLVPSGDQRVVMTGLNVRSYISHATFWD